jgi:hypothetical protein
MLLFAVITLTTLDRWKATLSITFDSESNRATKSLKDAVLKLPSEAHNYAKRSMAKKVE